MLIPRTELEQREAATLAPYAMKSRETQGRQHPEAEDQYRSAFQRDRDRVVHCTAFRRLEYKTQVFVNDEGDHYRTRLTHTLEVAQIARTVARSLALNEDLVEAVALAHDLGHTPFGHSGEEALSKLMEGHGGFEHNTHGLRVVDKLEKRYPHFDGLNLTWEVRESIVKHTTLHDRPPLAGFDPAQRPLLEAQVVEIADSIAYNCHDLDDALAAGIIHDRHLADVRLWQRAGRQVDSTFGELSRRMRHRQVVRMLINLQVADLLEATHSRLTELGIQDTADVRRAGQSLVAMSDEMAEQKRALEHFLLERMYTHYRVARMSNKARRFVQELFVEYLQDPAQLPPEYQELAAAEEEGLERTVCDYIAGMTDRYAQDEYKRLFYPFERV